MSGRWRVSLEYERAVAAGVGVEKKMISA